MGLKWNKWYSHCTLVMPIKIIIFGSQLCVHYRVGAQSMLILSSVIFSIIGTKMLDDLAKFLGSDISLMLYSLTHNCMDTSTLKFSSVLYLTCVTQITILNCPLRIIKTLNGAQKISSRSWWGWGSQKVKYSLSISLYVLLQNFDICLL